MERICEKIQSELRNTKYEYAFTINRGTGCETVLYASGESGLRILYNQICALCEKDADLMYTVTMCLQKTIRDQETIGNLKGRYSHGTLLN